MEHDPISTTLLRDLQKQLNASIDQYICSQEQQHTRTPPVSLPRIQASIHETALTLVNNTQDPVWKAADLGWSSTIHAVMKMAVDMGLFQMLDGPTKIQDLQKKTGADPYVLQRILRLITADGWLKQIDADTFEPNRFTIFALHQPVQDWIHMNWDMCDPLLAQVPKYFADLSYQAPSRNDTHPPVRRAFNKSTTFEWLTANPDQMAAFASAMRIQQLQSPAYLPVFPFTEELAKSTPLKPNDVAVVDVGGGLGHWLEQILTENPSLANNPGKLVLQDLQSVIDDPACTTTPHIECQKHDFFEPQPVLGARYYHMRGILHDWPDDDCVRILKALAPAMHKGDDYKSKLLINGWVLPAMGCSRSMAMNDVGMMVLGGMERTVEHYGLLLKEAGMRVVKVWRPELGEFCVVEAELA